MFSLSDANKRTSLAKIRKLARLKIFGILQIELQVRRQTLVTPKLSTKTYGHDKQFYNILAKTLNY